MDSILYHAAITGNINVLRQNEDLIGSQKTPDGKTVLHLASQLGKTKAVEVILSMRPSLLSLENQYRETALHLATRGGHVGVVQVLIDHAKKLDVDIESGPYAWQFIMWRENVDEETALHEAVRYNQPEVLCMLIDEDPSYSHSANKIEETPLYIAASRGSLELVNVILNNCRAPTYRGPIGTTALHGAVLCDSKECTLRLLEWKEDIIKETDSNGQTALHYAAACNFPNIASELLRADPSMAYIADNDEKMTALHIAASKGNLSVVKEILLHCPDSCGMVNKDMQNILHMAISNHHKKVLEPKNKKNHHKKVVEYIVEKCPVISSLINQRDVDGNTPCHLLTLNSGFYVPKLIKHAMVDKGALNNQRYTPLAMLMKKGVIDTWTKQYIRRALRVNGAASASASAHRVNGSAVGLDTATDDTEATTLELDHIKELRKYMSTHIIVAALIVTISFAAGFTMPGGYIQSGSKNQGMAVLSESEGFLRTFFFQVFMISDAIAFALSSIAVLYYMRTAQSATSESRLRLLYTKVGRLTIQALLATIIAFIAGTTVVSPHVVRNIAMWSVFILLFCFQCFDKLRSISRASR